jgi:hypothetical protein
MKVTNCDLKEMNIIFTRENQYLMKTESERLIIAEEIIISKIYIVRGKQVMIAQDLAELYQVDTKALNQQVKRNLRKFPERYML